MKKKTVTIGIPVYNEAENIGYLLESIIRQRQSFFTLEKIIVICDGTTDGTDKKVAKKAEKNPVISFYFDGKRKGKMARLLEIYRMNKSDFIFIFDGDIVLSNVEVINKMVEGFSHKNIAIVGGNNQPIPPETFTGKLISKWSHVWFLARSSYNNGDNIHNIRGCIMAMRSTFAKTIDFPKEIVSDAQFIYFYAKSRKLNFNYVKDAIVFYRKPNSFKDYMFQTRRSGKPENEKLAVLFGDSIKKKYKIPFRFKIGAFLKMILKDPIFTPLSAGFYLLSIVFPYKNVSAKNETLWKSATSTKKSIVLNN